MVLYGDRTPIVEYLHNFHHPTVVFSSFSAIGFALIAVTALWPIKNVRNQMLQDKVANSNVVMS
jgi:hypothetical protein